MFARPRIKRAVLPPPAKRRKGEATTEEIIFNKDARTEYLTGFHKRKQQRIKHAQEVAAKKARQEKIDFRKQIREERQQAVEDHVQKVHALLREAQKAGQEDDGSSDGLQTDEDEGSGFQDSVAIEPIDHEEEYIDEDRYTTVMIEAVDIDRDGLHKPVHNTEYGHDTSGDADEDTGHVSKESRTVTRDKRPKKKRKFRYETKVERRVAQRKQKAKRGKITR